MTSPPEPPELPAPGTRVSLRYLRPAGSQPPMGDVIGQLVEVGPRVQVRAGDGQLHEFRLSDVLYVRRLTDRPVKNSQIRSVEHAAALAWPGLEQHWLDGWLLRAGRGVTLRANAAIPLDMYARADTIPAIIDWYAQRGLTPRLAVPERLLRLPENVDAECETRTMVRDTADTRADSGDVALAPRPDEAWLDCYARDVPVEMLTAVLDGQVMFARIAGTAVGRAAVTAGPDGQRWVGLSEVRVAADQRRTGQGATVCAALLAWGREQGATQAYAQVRSDDPTAFDFFSSIGFAAQHHSRYLTATALHP